jgi:hypothetical protein
MGMAEAREFVCGDANGQNRLRNKCEAQRPTSICPALSFGYRNLINAARLCADFSFLTTSPAASALIVLLSVARRAPHGKERCAVMHQICWNGQLLRRQGADRADRSKVRDWYNKNCVGPRRPPVPGEP